MANVEVLSGRSVESAPKETIDIGPSGTEYIPFYEIHELDQIRQTYDEAEIERLALSMVPDPEALDRAETVEDFQAAINMGNPIWINRLDRDHISAYLEDYAIYWDQDSHVAHHFVALEEKGYVDIKIAGHRRGRAVEWLAKKYGFDLAQVRIAATVHHNLSFEELQGMQAGENTYAAPSPLDDAAAVMRHFNWLTKKEGAEPTIKRVAEALRYSPAKVSKALAFYALPSEIQEYARGIVNPLDPEKQPRPLLSYATVVAMRPLAEAMEARYSDEGLADDALWEKVTGELKKDANKLAGFGLNVEGINGKREQYILSRIDELQGSADYQDADSLFLYEGVDIKRQVQQSAKQLGAQAARVIAFLVKQGDITGDEVGMLIGNARGELRS